MPITAGTVFKKLITSMSNVTNRSPCRIFNIGDLGFQFVVAHGADVLADHISGRAGASAAKMA
jgi:hypothetical protein